LLLLLLLVLLLLEPEGVGVLLLPEGACIGTGGILRVTFLPTNKMEIFEQVSKALPPFLFLSLSFALEVVE